MSFLPGSDVGSAAVAVYFPGPTLGSAAAAAAAVCMREVGTNRDPFIPPVCSMLKVDHQPRLHSALSHRRSQPHTRLVNEVVMVMGEAGEQSSVCWIVCLM